MPAAAGPARRDGGAERSASSCCTQLDDYVLPRLAAIDAPLLAVVGGSTGAGKSTLVNSLVGADVSRSGRAATDHPLARAGPPPRRRATGSPAPGSCRGWPGSAPPTQPRKTTRSTCAWSPPTALPPGWPCSTPPTSTRSSTPTATWPTQLLAAADLWLFVTTAARYADAVPWELLRAGRRPRHVGGDRARPRAAGGGGGDPPPPRLDAARAGPGRGAAVHRDRDRPGPDGRLARTWTSSGCAPGWPPWPATRRRGRSSSRHTLTGALDSLAGAPRSSSTPAVRSCATRPLPPCRRGGSAYAAAAEAVDAGMTDGTLLRGEVLARWQEFVGTGEFFARSSPASAGCGTGSPPRSRAPRRRRETSARRCRAGVAALLTAQAQTAAASDGRAAGVGCRVARRCSRRTPTWRQPSRRLCRAGGAAGARLAGRRAGPGPHRGRGPAHDRAGRWPTGSTGSASC